MGGAHYTSFTRYRKQIRLTNYTNITNIVFLKYTGCPRRKYTDLVGPVVNDKQHEAKHVLFYEESSRTFEMTFYLSTFMISFVVYILAE